MDRFFITPRIPLVNAVTAWLIDQCRTTRTGVKSLSHLLVVVPTRQAGRRLRLALAEQTGGCIPPMIRLPAQMIVPAQTPDLPVCTPAETIALLSRFLLELDLNAFPSLFPEKGRPGQQSFSWALGVARQLNDLWSMLQENALTMANVASTIATILADETLDVEVDRWTDLAELEGRFFSVLKENGRIPASLFRKLAVAQPLHPEGIERIVLPGLVDAQPALYPVLEKLSATCPLSVLIHAQPSDTDKYDFWGRPNPAQWMESQAPLLALQDDAITLAANSAEQARFVAERFAAVLPSEERPSLGMADDSLFSELQSAFLSHNMFLHNPAAYPLSTASLGRLIHQLERLCSQPRFTVLAAFLREADVMCWLQARFAALPEFAYTDILRALDELQNTHLPQTLEETCRFCVQACEGKAHSDQAKRRWTHLRLALEVVCDLLDSKGRTRLLHLTAMLQTLFQPRTLEESKPGDRELAAAAMAAQEVFQSFTSSLVTATLDEAQQSQLFESLLAETTYQLEPDDPKVLLTEGWLELPWSPAQELVITGFNEGCVPDAVVGHAFLPDALRKGLGLTSNDRRTARDTCLLQALLTSRAPNAVRITLERVSSRNDVRKPSRLLFLCDEVTLTRRAKALFRDAETSAAGHPRSLPDAWRLALPLPQKPLETLAATSFKSYLACPFTFYLSHVLRMTPCDDRVAEMDALTFGNLCHHALERFGCSTLKNETNAASIATFLEAEVWTNVRTRFGENLPAVIHLQTLSACERLRFFATEQAKLRSEGRQIEQIEHPLALALKAFKITGRIDRIDYCKQTNTWHLLDYKTWDKLGKQDGLARFASSSSADVTFAEEQGFKSFTFADKPRVWTDLQLPLYLLMAQAGGLVPNDARVECGYFVLGETADETRCVTWDFSGYRDHAFNTIQRTVERLQAGLYWPPSPRDVWAYDFASLILESPEQSLSLAWLEDQKVRLAKGGQP
ncbi:MAG: PD-(D/E)XK nuclease family protein [bacterium]